MHSYPLGPVYGYAAAPTFGLRIVELAASRQGDEIAAGSSQLCGKILRVRHRRAACNAFIRQDPCADDELRTGRRAHRTEDLERQSNPILARASIAVRSCVGRRQKGGHRVGVGVVQFDAVKARGARARRCLRKERRKRLRQVGDVRVFGVGDALPVTHAQRLELACAQHIREFAWLEHRESRAQLGVGSSRHVERAPVLLRDREKTLEEFVRIRTPANGQKIDELDEESRLSRARAADRLDQRSEPREEPRIADPQKRPARDVANAGGLDDQGTRAAPGKALIPGEHVGRDQAIVGRAPRDHRRNPCPLAERLRTHRNRLEEPSVESLRRRRPAARSRVVANALGGSPHRHASSSPR
jgi:hypothetical protein